MPLILPRKPEQPVFDIPTSSIYKTDFVDRRILTIVGRSVLSEKNQPIKPSTDFKFRKCYAVSDEVLYKLKTTPDDHSSPLINFRVKIEEQSDYSLPFSYYYNYRRLRQKSAYYPINYELSDQLSPFITFYKNTEDSIPEEYQPSVSESFNLQKNFSYPEDAFRFSFQIIKADLIYNDILYKEPCIVDKKQSLPLEVHTFYRYELGLTNDLSESCPYDFSKYITKNLNTMIFTGLAVDLKPIETNSYIIIKKYAFETDYKLNKIFRYLELFNYVWEKIYEELTTTDIFAKFYLTFNGKLMPFLENLEINSKVSFISEVSNAISASTNNQGFNTRVLNTKKHLNYKLFPQNIPSSLKSDSISDFKIDLKNEKFDAYSLKKQILAGEKPLIVPIKYKSPRLALKLKINKPKLDSKTFVCKLQEAKKIKPILDVSKTNRLIAKYSKVVFNHQSQKEFKTNLNKNSIEIKPDYKLRRSSFFNKCPKHALYSYKKLHNILSNNTLNKKLKFLFKAFILPKLSPQRLPSDNQKYIYNNLSLSKLAYTSKKADNKIQLARKEINNIVFSEKPKISNRNNISIDKLIQSKRIGLNHLRKLKLLILNIFKKKLTYQISFLVPQNKILPYRLKQPLKHNLFSLIVLKKPDELYSQTVRKTDIFAFLNKYRPYDYSNYLPKQIVNQFKLEFSILDAQPEQTLVQKDIIPPPGWKKEIKKFICRLKLGPYPFGFPDFAFNPPYFYQLTTRDQYSIKDTTIDYIYKESFFILTKDKLYVHDLSMKKPKRILHSDITPKNSPKEYYASKPNDKYLKQDQPQMISAFTYSWQKDKPIKEINNGTSLFSLYPRIRNRKFLFKKLRSGSSKYLINDNYLNICFNPIMPQINRFLIKKSVYKLAKAAGSVIQKGFINNLDSKLPLSLKKEDSPTFVSKNLGCRIVRQKDWTLPQYFPDTYPANETEVLYTARFRSFRFPYIPEMSFVHEKAVLFAKETEDTALYSCKFQEDFRVSQFDFGLTEIHNLYTNKFDSDNIIQNQTINDFSVNSGSIYTKILNQFIHPSLPKPNLVKSEIPDYFRHLIAPRFFKAAENMSYKFKRRGQKLNSLKYTQDFEIPKENYYFKNDRLPTSFDMASFHWIILIRKKKDIITNLKYTSEEQIACKEEFSADYNFSSLKNKIYVPESYPVPTIPQFNRETFEKAVKFNKIILSVSFLSNSAFNAKEYNKNLIDFEVPKVQKSDLKEKAAFKYKIIEKGKYNGILKETENTIKTFEKSKLHLSAFIFDREKESFKLTTSARPRRITYRPAYIPDFMDINNKQDKVEIIDEFIE